MKFALAILWWQHRRSLKARGYSLDSFSEMTAAFWRNLGMGISESNWKGEEYHDLPDVFSRRHFRARW